MHTLQPNLISIHLQIDLILELFLRGLVGSEEIPNIKLQVGDVEMVKMSESFICLNDTYVLKGSYVNVTLPVAITPSHVFC